MAGRFDEAILRFGLALRLAPALAPAVLEATAGSRASGLLMVRGDAYRLAGHEDEAKEAYLAAARGGLPERRRRSRTRPAKTEPTVVADAEAGSQPEAASQGTEAVDVVTDTADDGAQDPADAAGLDDDADHIDPSAGTASDPPA